MSSPHKGRAALAALTAAAGVMIFLWLRSGDEDAGVTAPPVQSPAPAAIPASKEPEVRSPQQPSNGAQPSATGGFVPPIAQPVSPTVAPPVAPPVAVAPAPPPAVVAPVPAEGDLPINVVLTAPAEANNGSIVDIGLGIASERAVQLAVFHLTYDPAALEPLDLAPEATVSPSTPSGSADLELRFDLQQGSEWPVIRFVAHATAPQSTQITVTAQLWDPAGNAMAVGPPASQTMVLWQ